MFIDRVYWIAFNSFNEALWDRLGEVYSLLPHKIDTDFPHWYGIEGKDEFHLSASVEPSGLQVSGELREDDWVKWDSTFAKYLNDFPLFEVQNMMSHKLHLISCKLIGLFLEVSMNNIYDHAVPIPLPVHQDPQCFVLLQYIRDEIWAYFRIWNNEFKEDTKFIGCLHFLGVWAVKTERFTKCKYYPNVDEHDYLGYYLEIPSSKWLKELYDKREGVEGANWRDYDFREYKHYVVESNKNWIEIIASDVEFSKVLSKNHREKVSFFREI